MARSWISVFGRAVPPDNQGRALLWERWCQSRALLTVGQYHRSGGAVGGVGFSPPLCLWRSARPRQSPRLTPTFFMAITAWCPPLPPLTTATPPPSLPTSSTPPLSRALRSSPPRSSLLSTPCPWSTPPPPLPTQPTLPTPPTPT